MVVIAGGVATSTAQRVLRNEDWIESTARQAAGIHHVDGLGVHVVWPAAASTVVPWCWAEAATQAA